MFLSEDGIRSSNSNLTFGTTSATNDTLLTSGRELQLKDLYLTASVALSESGVTNLSTTAFAYTSSGQSPAGTYLLLLTDLVLTASGAVADFRYVGYYNNTATNDEMIGWWDYGSTVTGMASPDTFTIDFTTSTFTIV